VVELTELQADLVRLIAEHHRAHGFAPSVRDLMASARVASMSKVHGALVVLREQGLIEWETGLGRTLRVADRQ
jgi:SOS-response transcriptional repressor LexA